MNNYFNRHEYDTGFSTKCPCEENFPKQIDKSTETDCLREIPSSGSYVKMLAFYTMESPDKRKFLTDQHQQTFQCWKSVHVPQKITMEDLTFSWYCLSYLKGYLVSNLLSFLKESYLSKFQCSFILRKAMARNIAYKWCLTLGKKRLIIKNKAFGALLTGLS